MSERVRRRIRAAPWQSRPLLQPQSRTRDGRGVETIPDCVLLPLSLCDCIGTSRNVTARTPGFSPRSNLAGYTNVCTVAASIRSLSRPHRVAALCIFRLCRVRSALSFPRKGTLDPRELFGDTVFCGLPCTRLSPWRLPGWLWGSQYWLQPPFRRPAQSGTRAPLLVAAPHCEADHRGSDSKSRAINDTFPSRDR
jgi:hypothetical protein